MQSKQNQSNAFTSIVQKIKLSIKDFLVNVNKLTGNCGFVHIYQRNPWWKASFCAVQKERSEMEDEEKIRHFKLLDIREYSLMTKDVLYKRCS